VTAVVPKKPSNLPAVWTFVDSPAFEESLRAIEQAVKINNATVGKVPFDVAHWQKVAAEKYPHGLPKPFSSDPTQWLFNGHPKGSDQPWRGCSATSGRARPVPVFPIALRLTRTGWRS